MDHPQSPATAGDSRQGVHGRWILSLWGSGCLGLKELSGQLLLVRWRAPVPLHVRLSLLVVGSGRGCRAELSTVICEGLPMSCRDHPVASRRAVTATVVGGAVPTERGGAAGVVAVRIEQRSADREDRGGRSSGVGGPLSLGSAAPLALSQVVVRLHQPLHERTQYLLLLSGGGGHLRDVEGASAGLRLQRLQGDQ